MGKKTSVDAEALLRRASSELKRQRPQVAYRLLVHAAEHSKSHRVAALEAALDICQQYFADHSPETVLVATRLNECTKQGDGRALVALAVASSLRARVCWDDERRDDAWQLAAESKRHFQAALELFEHDSDAWASLGGLCKRMAQWARTSKDLDKAESLRKEMLDAYERGMQVGNAPYPTLNFLEYRSIEQPDQSMIRNPEEAAALDAVLHLRKQQFLRGEDAPWAAFDIARGQHYLTPNVPRFLRDLEVAIDDARRTARRASDRWRVVSAVTSLRDLFEARVPVEGLSEALLLVHRAVDDDGWMAGSWGPLGRPGDYLSAELRDARQAFESLAAEARASQSQLSQFLIVAEQRWTEDDEEKFAQRLEAQREQLEKEVNEFKRLVEPQAKKNLRVLWKMFGDDALAWACRTADVALPGAGKVGELVIEYFKKVNEQ